MTIKSKHTTAEGIELSDIYIDPAATYARVFEQTQEGKTVEVISMNHAAYLNKESVGTKAPLRFEQGDSITYILGSKIASQELSNLNIEFTTDHFKNEKAIGNAVLQLQITQVNEALTKGELKGNTISVK